MTTVAVLGTGTMGAGMARSLLRAGHSVRAWNRTAERAAPLADAGATVTASAAEAVAGADAVLIMLFDVAAVLEVLDAVAGSVPADAVVIQASTIGRAGMTAVAEQANRHRMSILDAPVLGTKGPAEQGELIVLLSGPAAAREQAGPVFGAIGTRTVSAGEELGAASALKLACNSWVAGLTALAGQAITLTRAAGLDPQLLLQAIGGGPTDAPYLQLKGTAMIGQNFSPSFTVDGVRKDVALMTEQAGRDGVSPTLLGAMAAVFDQASDRGHGADDMAAVISAF